MVSCFVVFSGINHSLVKEKLYWFIVLSIISFMRVLNHLYVPDTNPNKYHFYFIGVLFTSFTWAIFPVLFFEQMVMQEKFVSLVVFSSLAGGAINILSADIRSSFAYITFLLVPFSFLLLFQHDGDENTLGALGFALWFILCFVNARRAAKDVDMSIMNQLKLDVFIDDLEKEVQLRTDKIILLEQRDNLTQLFNRGSFISNVELDLKEYKYGIKAILFLDMDEFKLLNDKYGHDFGDVVLAETGRRLLSLKQHHDFIACRWGGDEFIVYSHQESQEKLLAFVEQLVGELTKTVSQFNYQVKPSFKVGLFFTDEGFELTQAIKYADVAMYQGKKSRNEVSVFDHHMFASLNREERLRSSINKSVEAGNFHLCYQPIVNVMDNKITAFEVLLRWEFENEFIPPSEFIDIAERYGKINVLGEFVLAQAIQSLKAFNDVNADIALSINVSVLQLENYNLLSLLTNLITTHQVNPNNIHLEITETVMSKNLSYLSTVISEIKNTGVRIAIDDFGTGFSSISVLKELSVDYIKIDKSYIDKICDHSKDESIVSAVTKMSHMIGCEVVAEGVESEYQLSLLAKLKVDKYQGFLFSKPIKLAEAVQLIS
jgi:diguanylate cyclase (GGDEF)-like protein